MGLGFEILFVKLLFLENYKKFHPGVELEQEKLK
jgi:hypothetical protein